MTLGGTADNFMPHLRGSLMARPPAKDRTASNDVIANTIEYELGRTFLSQAFVMVLFAVNWILTFAVLYIAVSAKMGMYVSEGLLVLPLGVILTVPSLRGLWVGAPAFGILLGASDYSCGLAPMSFRELADAGLVNYT